MSLDPRFFAFLHQRIGLDAASVGPAMIERAVRHRQDKVGAPSLEAYWTLLNLNKEEEQALIEAVIVPETWFMRYPESFAALGRLARARWHEQPGQPLRLLSLPCSTGEEPYSMVMALFDAGLPGEAFIVDGLDISPASLEKARRACYGRNSFRGEYRAYQARYFTQDPEGHRLRPSITGQVRLRHGNVLDPTLASETPYDFVFCRNLLIYFDVPTQLEVVAVLKSLTRPDGVLFIGPAEGSLLASNGMRPLGIAQAFAFVRQTEPSPALAGLSKPLPLASVSMAPARPLRQQFLPAKGAQPKAFDLSVSRSASSARVTARQDSRSVAPVEAGGSDAATLLAQIAALANAGQSADARLACERYLKQHPPQAQVYYWLGLLCDAAGNALEAQGYYRKALYLQPQHAETLTQLAMLLAAAGDLESARRLQARAARAMKEPRA
ncbi:CheR family methyltransferase [Pseudomonas sp. DC3000-4b1]|uniref:CheR family methyltransferase n=1 Tax=unclassified Pseudomonas TaxID=196821 RepID=UPI003CFADC15